MRRVASVLGDAFLRPFALMRLFACKLVGDRASRVVGCDSSKSICWDYSGCPSVWNNEHGASTIQHSCFNGCGEAANLHEPLRCACGARTSLRQLGTPRSKR